MRGARQPKGVKKTNNKQQPKEVEKSAKPKVEENLRKRLNRKKLDEDDNIKQATTEVEEVEETEEVPIKKK